MRLAAEMVVQARVIASIAASIAPQRVTPQPARSYGLHGLIREHTV
jgi:hypothetical protein